MASQKISGRPLGDLRAEADDAMLDRAFLETADYGTSKRVAWINARTQHIVRLFNNLHAGFVPPSDGDGYAPEIHDA